MVAVNYHLFVRTTLRQISEQFHLLMVFKDVAHLVHCKENLLFLAVHVFLWELEETQLQKCHRPWPSGGLSGTTGLLISFHAGLVMVAKRFVSLWAALSYGYRSLQSWPRHMPSSIFCVPSTAVMSSHALWVTESLLGFLILWELLHSGCCFHPKFFLGLPRSHLWFRTSFNHRVFVWSTSCSWWTWTWFSFWLLRRAVMESALKLGQTKTSSFSALSTHLIQSGGEKPSRKSADWIGSHFTSRPPATWSACQWEEEWGHYMMLGDQRDAC